MPQAKSNPITTPLPNPPPQGGREQTAAAARFATHRQKNSAKHLRLLLIAMLSVAFTSTASAADRIRLAVQRTGTLAWELDIIKAHGLDKKANLQ
ncbi:MAG: NitT/TauT family transport system substrate-binding protein, partial [Alphaproteobacteria bacterium]|nr:NitT/TauT family transport system substrate-binding protein [Alphaproteobacteria bacterium]